MGSSDRPSSPTVDDTCPAAPLRDRPLSLGDYEVGDAIGAGGMGEVLLAHDLRIGRDVAIKRMRDAAPNAQAVERFLREAKIQAQLDHPAIVPVYEVGYDADGRPYFIMKRLAGVTLAQRIEAGGAMQPLLRALIDVCFAIDRAHARKIVHRDLKPSNIMLGEYGEVYVLDWGVARVLGEPDDVPAPTPSDSSPSATRTGALLGTPGYIAPEQIQNAHAVAEPVDIYSLGAILFEILAGEPLHRRGDAIATTLDRPVESPAARRPERNIPPELDDACVAALAVDPSARPTARALAERLQSYLDGDRDVEHRRTLAARQLANATAALDAGRRSEGIFAAGRALALDPESLEASELVISLIVEPPQPLPPELEGALADVELAIGRARSRRSIFPVLAIFVVLPLTLIAQVASWPLLLGLFAATLATAAIAFLHSRFGWTSPAVLFFGVTLALVLFFSRLAGPVILTPILVCALTIVIGSRSAAWTVPVFAIVATLVPIALERLGVFSSTMEIAPGGGLWFGSSTFVNDTPPGVRLLGVIGGTVLLTVIVGMYSTTIVKQRRAAQRELYIQTWALQQPLPSRSLR